jgi:hypothetical protein
VGIASVPAEAYDLMRRAVLAQPRLKVALETVEQLGQYDLVTTSIFAVYPLDARAAVEELIAKCVEKAGAQETSPLDMDEFLAHALAANATYNKHYGAGASLHTMQRFKPLAEGNTANRLFCAYVCDDDSPRGSFPALVHAESRAHTFTDGFGGRSAHAPASVCLCISCLASGVEDAASRMVRYDAKAQTVTVNDEAIRGCGFEQTNPLFLSAPMRTSAESHALHFPAAAILAGVAPLVDHLDDKAVARVAAMDMMLRGWVAAEAFVEFNTNNRVFSRCPDHPGQFTYQGDPGEFRCGELTDGKLCSQMLCSSCHEWHSSNNMCGLAAMAKRCPQCRVPTEKISGCNRISCRCGAHWCYKCPVSQYFRTAQDCYSHLAAAHGGYFD